MKRDSDNELNITVNLHVHGVTTDENTLKYIKQRVDQIHIQGEKMAVTAAEMKQELVEINATTNEIGSDIDDLVTRVQPGLSETDAQEIQTELQSLKARLTGIAAVHTPASQV